MRASCTGHALLLAMILLASFPQGARADSATPTFGVLSLESVGVPPELGSTLTDSLRRQLGQISSAAVSAQDMVEVKLVFGCVDEKPTCLARAGRQLGVTRLIYGKLQPHATDRALVIVTLHQLAVSDALVEQSIEEAVAARILSEPGPELDRETARWLLALASPMKRAASEPGPNNVSKRWNRGLWISSVVFGVLASGAALTALWTWQGIGAAQDSANSHLDLLQNRLTATYAIEPYRGFFESSEQLSTCATVTDFIGDADYENYRAACQRGNTMATATTSLLVAAGSLAALSVTSLLLSRALAKAAPAAPRSQRRLPNPLPVVAPPPAVPKAPAPTTPPTLFVPDPKDVPDEEPPPAGEPKPASGPPITLGFDSVAPMVSPNGAGVVLQLHF